MQPHANRGWRIFAAIYPPQIFAENLYQALETKVPDPSRRVLPSKLHLTLSFLDRVEVSRLDAIRQRLSAICASTGRFRIQGLRFGYLPPVERPRLLVLYCKLDQALARLGHQCRRLDVADRTPDKPFLPHITVYRYKYPRRAAGLPYFEPEGFEVSRVHLMRSELTGTGAVHTCLDRFLLQ